VATDGEHRIAENLREHGQEHLLALADSLSQQQRRQLMRDLGNVDFARLDEFRSLLGTPPTDISFSDVTPPQVERLPLTEAQQKAEAKTTRVGQKALKKDRVAALTVAGGHGTRLNYDGPKGTFAISPLRGKSFFALFAEQILAARRRYRCRMPWLIMNSPRGDAATREYFREHDFFGLGQESVHFFVQRSNPILDSTGRLLLGPDGRLLTGPDGHGGVFEALADSGLLDVLRQGGWDLISYCQVDNPLVTIADARFIGHHLRKGAEFSCKVAPKRDPAEGLGLAVNKASRAAVVEYVDVPEDAAAARSPSGKLRFTFGSIAIHVISMPFAEQAAQDADFLPWHIARKRYETFGSDGKPTVLDECCKFERFVFDALPLADACAFVEVRRDTEFAPVKNAEGEDTPAAARSAMQRMWLQWLRAAGVAVDIPKDLSQPIIEVSPLFAMDEEELKKRIEPGWRPSLPLILEP